MFWYCANDNKLPRFESLNRWVAVELSATFKTGPSSAFSCPRTATSQRSPWDASRPNLLEAPKKPAINARLRKGGFVGKGSGMGSPKARIWAGKLLGAELRHGHAPVEVGPGHEAGRATSGPGRVTMFDELNIIK